MRLFIAVDFNELRDYFLELQNKLPKNARLSLVKSFHLTLKFLGEIQQDDAGKVIGILKKIKFNKFDVSLGSIGIFPTENYIRVVWIGLNPEENILELQKNVDEALNPMFRKEKDFKAHITLARVKYPSDKEAFLDELRRIMVENKTIEIKDFKLVKSALSPKGPVYEDLAVFAAPNI